MKQWFAESGLSRLVAAIEAAGGELRIVGGAVRDHVMGRSSKELDAATTLHPEIMSKVAQDAGFKVIPTGIAHGTVTVLLPERSMEITTLRNDVACDGRHAEVAYTNDWQQDAARRDFTMNALYVDRHATLYDYFDGQKDIAQRCVRFIGDAEARIEEDALRILRFYRFLATHGSAPANPQALVACKLKRGLVEGLSGERIAQEMRKLLSASDPLYSMEHMQKAELDQLLVHAPFQLAAMPLLIACEQRERIAPDWMVRLLAMVDIARAESVVTHVIARWKLSNKEAEALRLLANSPLFMDEDVALTHKKYLRAHGRAAYLRVLVLSAAHGLIAILDPWLQLANRWEVPEFPVASREVMALGYEGKALGEALKQLEKRWEASEYTLSNAELLAMLA